LEGREEGRGEFDLTDKGFETATGESRRLNAGPLELEVSPKKIPEKRKAFRGG